MLLPLLGHLSASQLVNLFHSLSLKHVLLPELLPLLVLNHKSFSARELSFYIEKLHQLNQLPAIQEVYLTWLGKIESVNLWEITMVLQCVPQRQKMEILESVWLRIGEMRMGALLKVLSQMARQAEQGECMQQAIREQVLQRVVKEWEKIEARQQPEVFANLARMGCYLQAQIPAVSVPKQQFCYFLFALVNTKQWDQVEKFMPIVQQLQTYGDLKYFFSHADFVHLVYALMLIHLKFPIAFLN